MVIFVCVIVVNISMIDIILFYLGTWLVMAMIYILGYMRGYSIMHDRHMKYKPSSHSLKDCLGEHPILHKVPVGFQGFHDEDYQDN